MKKLIQKVFIIRSVNMTKICAVMSHENEIPRKLK